MKSYEEMADAVLVRARAEKAVQNRRNRRLLIAAVCVCFAGLVVFAGATENQSVGDVETRAPRVSVFCVSANASEQRQQMVKGEKVPYNAEIRVRDISGLGEQELAELRNADKEYARQMAGQDSDGNNVPNWGVTSFGSDKTLITSIYVGSFYMTVEDYNQIQDVTATTTEIGWTAQHLADYHDDSLRDGIGITWSLSGAGVDMIEKNPGMALSELKDTITVTVEFKDGSKDIVTIDITVDDDGQIYGTFQGTDVIA